jgi:hypothetical protein
MLLHFTLQSLETLKNLVFPFTLQIPVLIDQLYANAETAKVRRRRANRRMADVSLLKIVPEAVHTVAF